MNQIRLKLLIDQAEAMIADAVRKNTDPSGEYVGPPVTALIEAARKFLEENGLIVNDCRTETYTLLRHRPPQGDPIDEKVVLDATLSPEERARSLSDAVSAFKAKHGADPITRDALSVKFSASYPSAAAE